MATIKAIAHRLKSVKSIRKITQSMKMVSAAKYARAERDLKNARPYGEGATQFYEKAEVEPQTDEPKQLYIAITSDRGLCGAVHSTVAKAIRARMTDADADKIKLICVGDKSRAILSRVYSKNILFAVNEIGRVAPSFSDASRLASAVINSGYDFGSGKIVYNKFVSVVAYQQNDLPLFSKEAVSNAPKLATYDSLDADVLQSYLEFSLTSLLFYALKEGACAEQSARMTAMDNAAKNAQEMIEKLTLTFNRTRQAQITRELIEIISGAAALE